jgi:hypothetical protein
VLAESVINQATEVGEMEENASSSPELEPNPVSLESSSVVPENDPRIAALNNWGVAAQRKRFERVKARFDALPDPRLGAAA